MSTLITPEELMSVSAFIDGQSDTVPYEVITRLQQLSLEASRALVKAAQKRAGEAERLQRKIDRMNRREDAAVETGEAFAELGYDSVDVANALIARLKEVKTYQMTKDKVSLILFEIYASWLASKKERICIEHPQATPYGPRFWRAYGKMDFSSGDDAVARLNALNPGLSVMVANAAKKYYDYSTGDLEKYLKKSEPYRKASPAPGGKWNTELNDSEIYWWKKSENTTR